MDKILYTQADFMNLTLEEVADIKKIMELNIPKDTDEKLYLFNNINMLEKNEIVNKKISNKVLAGQVSIKWLRFEYDENLTKDILEANLNNTDKGYLKDINQRLDKINSIASIVKLNNIYTLKILMDDGYRTVNDGITIYRERKIKSAVVKIDSENRWLELRCNEVKIPKLKIILSDELGLKELKQYSILKNFSNDVTQFKNSLFQGRYMNWTAIPSEPLELTEEDNKSFVSLIKLIDDYLSDKDSKKLIDALEKLDFKTEDFSIIAILLAGVSNMGMGIDKKCKTDMSDQSLYALLKDYILENKSYISFSNKDNGMLYTMQVGIVSNNIVFRSSVTEEVIEYIRNKIL